MSTYDVRFDVCNDIANTNREIREEAREIIEHRLPTFIDKCCEPKTLQSTRLVRLDLQGQFSNKYGIRYANLQIQLNRKKKKKNPTTASGGLTDESEEEGEDVADAGRQISTTIAIVLMPSDENIPRDIMKRAFNGSLDGGKKATIFKTR